MRIFFVRIGLASLVLFFYATDSSCDEQPSNEQLSIIVCTDTEHGYLAQKAVGELNALGFMASSFLYKKQQGLQQSLDALAKAKHAMAAIQLEMEHGTVKVWVADRTTLKVVSRKIVLSNEQMPVEELVATSAVELLRASLMELHSKAVPQGEIPPSKKAVEFSRPPAAIQDGPRRFISSFGVWGHFIGADLSLGMSGTLGFYVKIIPKFQLGILAQWPFLKNQKKIETGTIKTKFAMIAADMLVTLIPPPARISLHMGIGGGVGIVTLTAEAASNFQASSDIVATPLVFAHLIARIHFSKTVALYIDAVMGATTRDNQIFSMEQKVASYGRPIVNAGLGLNIYF